MGYLVDADFNPQAGGHHDSNGNHLQQRNLPRVFLDGSLAMQFAGPEGGLSTVAMITRPTDHADTWPVFATPDLTPESERLSLDQHNTDGLRELQLYDFVAAATEQAIADNGIAFRRGRLVSGTHRQSNTVVCLSVSRWICHCALGIQPDGNLSGWFLKSFCSVLWHEFLCSHRLLNAEKESVYHQWPPRSGDQIVP